MLDAERFASSLAYESHEVQAIEVYKAMWQAAPDVEQEPARYEYRVRMIPDRPFDTWTYCNKEWYELCKKYPIEDIWEYEARALYTNQQQPMVEQEPIKYEYQARKVGAEWHGQWGECSKDLYERYNNPFYFDGFEYQARALYTHPQPKREPLSGDEIDALWVSFCSDLSIDTYADFVRLIEKAHGIGVE